MQSGLIQMNGLQPSEAGLGGPTDPARDGSQSAGMYSFIFHNTKPRPPSQPPPPPHSCIILSLAPHNLPFPLPIPIPAAAYYCLLSAAVLCNAHQKKCLWHYYVVVQTCIHTETQPELAVYKRSPSASNLLEVRPQFPAASVNNHTFLHKYPISC